MTPTDRAAAAPADEAERERRRRRARRLGALAAARGPAAWPTCDDVAAVLGAVDPRGIEAIVRQGALRYAGLGAEQQPTVDPERVKRARRAWVARARHAELVARLAREAFDQAQLPAVRPAVRVGRAWVARAERARAEWHRLHSAPAETAAAPLPPVAWHLLNRPDRPADWEERQLVWTWARQVGFQIAEQSLTEPSDGPRRELLRAMCRAGRPW